MGTAEFAVPSLDALLAAGYHIPVVVTAPDKPQGRGLAMRPSQVKRRALSAGLPVLQPPLLKDPSFADAIRALDPDLIIVVAFRILPPSIFTVPRRGSINLHASLLPRYRGAAPINRAIMMGETETGVTTFLLDEKIDTGGILLQERTPIFPDDDAGSLHDRLEHIGAEVVLRTVRLIEQGKAVPRTQDSSVASPAPKIFHEDCRILWERPANVIRNQIRGLSPAPGAFFHHADRTIKAFRANVVDGRALPGHVNAGKDFLHVGTGEGLLSLEELQMEGRKRMPVAEFLRGYPVQNGQVLS
jgi:methionyl-tRNA formyltransferase